MPEVKTIAQRHANMAAIRGKNTKPEIIVRKYLWRHGFRYRLNHGRLPGRPDIVLRQYRTCIFVNGCFWHGHNVQEFTNYSVKSDIDEESLDSNQSKEIENSECCKIPKSNKIFWVKKILRNKERDIEVQHKLARMGWHSITIWECELKPKRREATLQSLVYTLSKIYLQDHKVVRYELPDEELPKMVADDIKVEYGKT